MRLLSRGQIFTTDIVIAVSIFVVALVFLISIWNSILLDNAALQRSDMKLSLLKATDALVKSQGMPAGWNESNVVLVGLAVWDRTIDARKLASFLAMDYNKSKSALGVQGYDYYFRLINANVTKGEYPQGDAVYTQRKVFYNGIETIEFTVWKR